VQTNGGHLDFVSQKNKGSTFIFTFGMNEAKGQQSRKGAAGHKAQ